MLKRLEECKKLARGQQNEGDRSRAIGVKGGGGKGKKESVQEDGNERR